MLDTIAENLPDRRPAILVCVYEPDEPLRTAVEPEGGSAWTPPGARVRAVGAGAPSALADALTRQLDEADCRAVLLVGRTRKSSNFRVQMRAENKTAEGGGKVSRIGPAFARATAPAAEMVRELIDAGLAAEATSESEEDVGSYLLYRVLTALPDNADAPSVGLLRVPGSLGPDQLRRGVQTATDAMARHLSPLPRARFS